MASSNDGASAEEVSDAYQFQSFSMPVSAPSIVADDSEEWEYEYSTTETEVNIISSRLETPQANSCASDILFDSRSN